MPKPASLLLRLSFLPAIALALASAGPAAATSALDRPLEPVVISASLEPRLGGQPPAAVVAFRYKTDWQQVPVQVDERAVVNYGDIYNVGGGGGDSGAAGQAYPKPTTFSELVYTDTGTFTGGDPNPYLDADDEIAFMARDAGGLAPEASEPAGVLPNTGVRLTITDSLDAGATGYVYLFVSDGSLVPGAGQQYVSYDFNLLSGPYLTTYNTLDGPNPENSTAGSPYYTSHFSDRPINDQLMVTVGGSTGVDILDRHRALFAPGVCSRSEDTFANGEGAFIANKSGPVRVIRSYVGANSGPLTQRDEIFYERRQETRTFLRVHAIPSVMDFYDYSLAASGMTYYNNANTGGVTIDGAPDAVTGAPLSWEMVTGLQGTVIQAESLATNLALTPASYYQDDSTPPDPQCTGDASTYGASGSYINQAIACTDPALGCSNYLRHTRVLYYEQPNRTVAQALTLVAQANAPLNVVATLLGPVGGFASQPDLRDPLPGRASSGSGGPLTAVGLALAAVALVMAGLMLGARRRTR